MARKLMLILLSGVICLLGATSAFAVKYNEAPVLRTRVAAGELPPVEQRLPDQPVVVNPIEEIGQYGGTWNYGVPEPAAITRYNMMTYDPLLRYEVKGNESSIVPNVAESWEVSDEGRVFTFKLRKGMKWSDGVSFTADDIMFWYEDMILNDELSPAKPTWLVQGGELAKVEKIDDYTIRFDFSDWTELPGRFLIKVATHSFYFYPKHYLRRFHPRYTSMEKLKEMADKEGFTEWFQLFGKKQDQYRNPDLPSIKAWKVKTFSVDRVIYDRNPYYWKVDPEGNQLPYIDQLALNVLGNVEVLTLKGMAGELDMQFWWMSLKDYSLWMTNREKGRYRILEWIPGRGSDLALYPNLNCKDSVLRKLIENRKFRQALSVAINRDEINELVYLGLGKPRQATVISVSPFYKEEYAKAYAEYSPEKANNLLDEIGLVKRDEEGYRLRPDGQTLSLTIETIPTGYESDVLGLVKEGWESIGIKTTLKILGSGGQFAQRVVAGEVEIGVWEFGYAYNPITEPVFVVPIQKATYWAPLNGIWYSSGGTSGEKPTGDVLRLQELWRKIEVTLDPDQQNKLMEEILKLHYENTWVIGLVGELPELILVKDNFRNVTETGPFDSVIGRYIGRSYPEQFFFKK